MNGSLGVDGEEIQSKSVLADPAYSELELQGTKSRAFFFFFFFSWLVR